MTTKSKQSTGSKLNHPHIIIPSEDTTWAISQKPSVLRFWQQCWLADPFGSRWMKLVTNLSDSAFRLARRVLEAAGLFIFRRISTGSDGRTSFWEVKNLHGARVKDFWQSEKNEADTASNKADNISIKANTATNETNIATQTQSEQGFCEPSRTSQEHLTTSFEEIVRCISDTLKKDLHVGETASAPFGGASPLIVKNVSEKKEELPTVTDCTSLTLVDVTQSKSVLLLGEKQDLGEKVGDCLEDTFSAAPVASIAENSSQPTSLSASLMANDSSSVQEPKKHHEGESSALADSNPEKWSHEAVVARSKARPWRMEKLKMAERLGENPSDDFLMGCWADDPALRIVINKLVRKFPQWGFVTANVVLMKANE